MQCVNMHHSFECFCFHSGLFTSLFRILFIMQRRVLTMEMKKIKCSLPGWRAFAVSGDCKTVFHFPSDTKSFSQCFGSGLQLWLLMTGNQPLPVHQHLGVHRVDLLKLLKPLLMSVRVLVTSTQYRVTPATASVTPLASFQ
ncbi:hypothetical protein FOCC_FOCC011521, partial [Frankliniella occidentalis]